MSAVLLIVTVFQLNCVLCMLFLVFVCYRGLLLCYYASVMFFFSFSWLLIWFLVCRGLVLIPCFQFLFNFGLTFHTASAVVNFYHFVSNLGICLVLGFVFYQYLAVKNKYINTSELMKFGLRSGDGWAVIFFTAELFRFLCYVCWVW